jgi:uncharacterized protein
MFRDRAASSPERGIDEAAAGASRHAGRAVAAGRGPGSMPLGLIVAEGLAVGVLTGLVGVGGGFLIVPALVLLGGIPMKEAVGTSLLVIGMKSSTGFLGYLGQVEVPWGFMASFTAVAIAGILGGSYLVRFVRQEALKRAFAVFLVVMGGFILYQNRAVFLPHELAGARAAPESGVGMAPGPRATRAY